MDTKNIILASVLSVGILLLWSIFVEQPVAVDDTIKIQQTESSNIQSDSSLDSLDQPAQTSAVEILSVEDTISDSPRIEINTPGISGSIRLNGLVIDDVVLKAYQETLEADSNNIRYLSPLKTGDGHEVSFGWIAKNTGFEIPNRNTPWQLISSNSILSIGSPLTFEWKNNTGQIFQAIVSIDDEYLFNIEQKITNNGSSDITVQNKAQIIRENTPDLSGMFILHEGLVGVLDEKLELVDYDDLAEEKRFLYDSNNGWLGFTDKYWLTAIIPEQNTPFKAIFNYDNNYSAYYRSQDTTTVSAGSAYSTSSNIFIGAKEADLLDRYQEEYGFYNFDLAIDWGWFYFLTKPLFYIIYFLFDLTGNFGIAIIILTAMTRVLFFPLANWSFTSMAKMKKLQPEMTRLKELHKDDRQQQQQALMTLYKKEKVNPVSGCVPILIQIPFFFAIYKMLFVSLEMRHAPFFGWIQDLSAKDPTSLFNLFGLIPWDPPSFLVIGVWPILMGLTMWIQQKLNPAPPDPIQAKIFMFFPFFITVLLSQFAAGLVIYWTTNNLLSIIQQWIITRRTTIKTN
ncbi:MAG: membrane protein insertase YidC [Candidatus Pelagibacterales bacterium]|jgi:YidC/Oxa1 family membrane protein insertase|tara:strand:- start:7629 stop:9332 length:1704 start_codon:yes stop_codon:yes gene_type:complete